MSAPLIDHGTLPANAGWWIGLEEATRILFGGRIPDTYCPHCPLPLPIPPFARTLADVLAELTAHKVTVHEGMEL